MRHHGAAAQVRELARERHLEPTAAPDPAL
jgi:hypothetical protein